MSNDNTYALSPPPCGSHASCFPSSLLSFPPPTLSHCHISPTVLYSTPLPPNDETFPSHFAVVRTQNFFSTPQNNSFIPDSSSYNTQTEPISINTTPFPNSWRERVPISSSRPLPGLHQFFLRVPWTTYPPPSHPPPTVPASCSCQRFQPSSPGPTTWSI